MPPALAAYWQAIDAARFADAAACFGADVVYAEPRRGAVETYPRSVTKSAVTHCEPAVASK